MIKFDNQSKISEVQKPTSEKKQEKQTRQPHRGSATRPYVVDAKVYKLKSAFVKNSVFVTLSYINEGEAPPGTFHTVEISAAYEYDLVGRIV